ncbi:MAG: hypothetical protein EA384_00150 [Spirochaetaceae bacterium]|nr:MAG: hypothetical protein EA384_00150 [Spirochaetaceae bacterium]
MSDELERYRAQRSQPPAGVQIPDGFGYVQFKAFLYLELGPEGYRERDALQMPPADWPQSALEAIGHGCRQLFHWRGLSAEAPLEGIGIDGFYRLIRMFHFRVAQQTALTTDEDDCITDRMSIRHIVTGKELTLYNRVPQQTEISF